MLLLWSETPLHGAVSAHITIDGALLTIYLNFKLKLVCAWRAGQDFLDAALKASIREHSKHS